MDGLGAFRDHQALQLPLYGEFHCAVLYLHRNHLSFQIPELDKRIGRLTEWMEKRVSNMGKLLQLQGKLELVVEQIAIRSKPVIYATQEPGIIFDIDGGVEGDDGEEDSVDEEEMEVD